MTVYGREIKFLRTVGATIKVADMCPDGEIENVDRLFEGNYQMSQKTAAKFMSVLSESYEDNKAYWEPGYKGTPLSEEEALALPGDVFNELFIEAVKAYTGEKPTVETEPVKKTAEEAVKKSDSTEPGSSSTEEN